MSENCFLVWGEPHRLELVPESLQVNHIPTLKGMGRKEVSETVLWLDTARLKTKKLDASTVLWCVSHSDVG